MSAIVRQMNHKVLAIISGFLLSFLTFAYLTQTGHISTLLLWMGKIGLIGNLLLVVIYLVTSFPVPMGTTPLALSAGFLYGISLGFLTVTVGSVVGAVVAFWICRKLLADWVSVKVKANPRLLAVMGALEKHSFKLCFFVRMSPIPFGIQNSIFAISKINFKVYLFASFLGLFPEQLMLVYFGSTAKELKDIFEGKENFGTIKQLLVGGQILICIAILGFLIYTGRKAFNEAVKREQQVSME